METRKEISTETIIKLLSGQPICLSESSEENTALREIIDGDCILKVELTLDLFGCLYYNTDSVIYRP